MKEKTPSYLFVCMANLNRSPTAEEVFKGLAKSKGMHVKTSSAGLSHISRQPIDESMVKHADLIFVMEEYMKDQIVKVYNVDPGRIIVLGIPDIYEKDDPVLVKILLDELEPYVEETEN